MPGRITDELRRIARHQGRIHGSPAKEAHDARPSPARHGALLVLLGVMLLVGIGWLIVRRLIEDSKLQDCVMSGRKNCAPVDSAGR